MPVPGPPPLRTSIVVDYQNVHLVGHDLFGEGRRLARHQTLVDPLHFANQLLRVRNANQGPGYAHARLCDVLVYRGKPSNRHDPQGYARNQAQKAQWERDRRVHVTLRPLTYRVQRDASGRPVRDIHGRETILEKREKGVDVLCALAAVREAARTDIELVILASHDSDLEPAIEAVLGTDHAKVETFCWRHPDQFSYQLARHDRRVWNTALDKTSFENCRDRTEY
ncbi:MAG: hypothetical protein ACRCY9_05700 [Phycicoccus sp.]